MRKIKTYVSLALGAVMSVSLLAGCSTDELAWYKAMGKAQEIRSMESKTDVLLRVSATNMSKDEEAVMQQVLPLVNGAKLSVAAKTVQNADSTSAKMEGRIGVATSQMSINTGLWVDVDVTGDKQKVKEIFEIPDILAPALPKELKGKKYLVLDTASMSDQMPTSPIDNAKITEFSKNYQKKFVEFMDKYIQQYKPSFDVVTKKGNKIIVQPTGTVSADIYELNLNDKNFKDLIKYSVNNFASNKDAIDFIKYTLESVINLAQLPQEQAAVKDEMLKAFAQFEKDLPKYLEEFNKGFDTIKDLKILGDNGIKIQYAVNADGYIINETGTVEFVIDLPAIEKLVGQSTGLTGVYTVTFDYSSDIYNINKALEVKFPELTEANSIDYMKLMESMMMPNQEVMKYNMAVQAIENAKQTKVFADYNNAYAAILELPKNQQAILLNELAPLWNDVYTEDIAKILGEMSEFAANKDIKRYHALENKINAEVKRSENKGYLLGELTGWGLKGVYTEDVTAAIDSIKAAWAKKDTASIEAAQTSIDKVSNQVTREWLVEQLNELKATLNK